jgi:hypothetical protein
MTKPDTFRTPPPTNPSEADPLNPSRLSHDKRLCPDNGEHYIDVCGRLRPAPPTGRVTTTDRERFTDRDR